MNVPVSTSAAARRSPGGIPPLPPQSGPYRLDFATGIESLEAAQRLRYEVFNLELEEGLEASHRTGLDCDRFDAHCHHLIIREKDSNAVVGTYRMQTAGMAAAGEGFYSATEFRLEDLPHPVLDAALEIGRACIDRRHRNLKVLYLLWQGLGHYVRHNRLGFLFGCCSLTSQDPHEATRVFRKLEANNQLDSRYRVHPLPPLSCLIDDPDPGSAHIPRLMRAYLSLGATICSEPAIDRVFGTIDYLALFDLATMSPARLAFFTGFRA
ncbi:MAG: GNAT family N-acetyltransferase [Rhodothermales bacterium]|nr:GNAT family N-acetyltransferase [Rhodothermales bacterium]